jgi:hypothetical protein
VSERKNIFELKQGSEKNFGYVFAFFLFILATYPLTKNDGLTWELLLASICMLLVALFKPSILRPANLAWIKLGIFLGKFISPIVMGGIYLFSIVPVGIVLKIFRKDSLAKKINPKAKSYWIERELVEQNMKDQF